MLGREKVVIFLHVDKFDYLENFRQNMEKSDEKIIEEYLSGNEAAFSELVKKHLKPAYNFIFRLVNNRDTAEDLTQETFVKVWKNSERGFSPSPKIRLLTGSKRKKRFCFQNSRMMKEIMLLKIYPAMKSCRTKFWSEKISQKIWKKYYQKFRRVTARFYFCTIKKTFPSTKSPKFWANPTTQLRAGIKGGWGS